jgi:ferritin
MNPKMEKAINTQINAELFSAYLYLAMAAYFDAESLSGFASWMKMQAQEETSHAMKLFDYVNERGGRVVLEMIEKPQSDFDSPQAIFEQTLAHEKKVTGLINDLCELANDEKDLASASFLQWFVDEQVEEEETASEILEKVKLAGKDDLPSLDKELGARVFVPNNSEK